MPNETKIWFNLNLFICFLLLGDTHTGYCIYVVLQTVFSVFSVVCSLHCVSLLFVILEKNHLNSSENLTVQLFQSLQKGFALRSQSVLLFALGCSISLCASKWIPPLMVEDVMWEQWSGHFNLRDPSCGFVPRLVFFCSNRELPLHSDMGYSTGIHSVPVSSRCNPSTTFHALAVLFSPHAAKF